MYYVYVNITWLNMLLDITNNMFTLSYPSKAKYFLLSMHERL